MKKMLFLAIAGFAFFIRANGQNKGLIPVKNTSHLRLKDTLPRADIVDSSQSFFSNTFICHASFQNNMPPANHYSAGIGFFCKKELAVEKITKLPLRFRLGSLNYCNQLEGKEK